jgi:hypothetical protein
MPTVTVQHLQMLVDVVAGRVTLVDVLGGMEMLVEVVAVSERHAAAAGSTL